MTTYEDILIEADSHDLITREKPLRAHKGRIKGNRIAINKNLTEKEVHHSGRTWTLLHRIR